VKYERRSVGVFDALDRNNKQRLMRMRQMESFQRLARRPLAKHFFQLKIGEMCLSKHFSPPRPTRQKKKHTANLQFTNFATRKK